MRCLVGRLAAGAALVCAVSGLAGPLPAVAAEFDGPWSVLIITERGDCDPAYRYPITIDGGRVRYQGDTSVAMNGTVAAGGAVKVSIRLGDRSATGSGKLAGRSGSGLWRGEGANATCAGRWEAEKR